MDFSFQEKSEFHRYREKYVPNIPDVLKSSVITPKFEKTNVDESIKKIFSTLCENEQQFVSFTNEKTDESKIVAPLRVGVVLSGGQAPGGHNVIVGIYDYLKKKHQNSQLFGFLNGPHGIFTGNYIELRDDIIDYYRNRGGFDMICSGRHKIETEEQFNNSLLHCESLKLDGLVVIGGDDSNTNACLLAEFFKKKNSNTKVIGCPKTIDGDLKNEYVEVSFGFDTACKTYSELIGNIALDTRSSKKYYHFIRLMGRSASHITLECAFLTRPNCALIGEEVYEKKLRIHEIVNDLANLICQRAEDHRNFGVILVPEGLIEFIVEVNVLIKEINEILAKMSEKPSDVSKLFNDVVEKLTPDSVALMKLLPPSISEQLLLDRDPHGNVQVSKIETEKMLIMLLESELKKRKAEGKYHGEFASIAHFFGYEGRCAFPTNFDCDYCYSLGLTAAALIDLGQTGMMSVVRNLDLSPEKWVPGGCPLVTMMNVERRKGKDVPVIKKALVDLDGDLFKLFAQEREEWRHHDFFQYPGPIQFEFPMKAPFLVKAPTKDQLYLHIEKKYDEKSQPYARIFPLSNVSPLALDRTKSKPGYPSYFKNGHFKVVQSTNLEYNSEETKNAAYKNYFTLANEQAALSLIEIVDSSKKVVSSQKVLNVVTKTPRIGVIFCGRQCPGAHNVISGLLEFTRENKSELYGFIDGTKGFFNQKYIVVTEESLEYYVNQGGMHYLGRSADKIRSSEELELTLKCCNALKLDGLVLIGATHTLTDGIIVSDYLLAKGSKTGVITIPASVDGNVHHHMLEGIVGFDTATKIYSQLIGNIMIDAASAIKYWYFMRLMGRDPSHLVLECALQTRPNMVLISEEIASLGKTLNDIVDDIADLICERAKNGKHFGTILIPEGLLLHVSQFKYLIEEFNAFFTKLGKTEQIEKGKKFLTDDEYVKQHLTGWSAALFLSLPDFTKEQLVLEREAHGSTQLSQIETERLLANLVADELKKRKSEKRYNGSFSSVTHFFGYQGRCGFPSKFDCDLANTYGYLAGVLIQHGVTGYNVTTRGLADNIDKWNAGGIPLLSMTWCKAKTAYGENRAIIPSYEVDLRKEPFRELEKLRNKWRLSDFYSNPGPTQFYGSQSNNITYSLKLSHGHYPNLIRKIEELTEDIKDKCRFGAPAQVLQIAILNLENLKSTLDIMKANIK